VGGGYGGQCDEVTGRPPRGVVIDDRAVQPHGQAIACIEAPGSCLAQMAETIALTRLENAPVAFRGLLEGRTFGKRVVRVAEA